MFRYLADPLFLCCMVSYALNRWALRPILPPDEAFFRGYFNDLLVIPCAIPPVLFLHRHLRLRSHDRPPTAFEIAIHLLIWSVILEVIGPRVYSKATADPLDVGAYCVGAVVAWLYWNRHLWLPARTPAPAPPGDAPLPHVSTRKAPN